MNQLIITTVYLIHSCLKTVTDVSGNVINESNSILFIVYKQFLLICQMQFFTLHIGVELRFLKNKKLLVVDRLFVCCRKYWKNEVKINLFFSFLFIISYFRWNASLDNIQSSIKKKKTNRSFTYGQTATTDNEDDPFFSHVFYVE